MCIKVVVHRVKQIFFEPKKMWGDVDKEEWTLSEVYKKWVIGFSALTAMTSVAIPFVAMGVMGKDVYGMHFLSSAVYNVVDAFIMDLIFVGLIGVAISEMAVTFGGKRNLSRATRLVGYAITPLWLAHLFSIPSALALLMNGAHWNQDAWVAGVWVIATIIGAIYYVYLITEGLPVMMTCKMEKRKTYVVAVIATSLILQALLWMSGMGMG